MILEQLLHQQHILAVRDGESFIPIPSFDSPILDESEIIVRLTSDSGNDSNILGATTTVKYASPEGDITGNQYHLLIGEYFFIQIPLPEGDTFKLKFDIPFWLEDTRIEIWKGQDVPQFPIFPTSSSRVSIPQTPTTTAASATAVQIAAARSGRNRLSIYNNSNGNMYVRYAPTGTGTNATTAAGGFDEIIAAGNVFEYPGNDYPESAINAIWSVAVGVTLSGNCTVSEGIRG